VPCGFVKCLESKKKDYGMIASTKEKLGHGFMFEEVSKPNFAY
jgi:hypothetical protein